MEGWYRFRSVGVTSITRTYFGLGLGARPMGSGIGGTHARKHRKKHDPDADRPTKNCDLTLLRGGKRADHLLG